MLPRAHTQTHTLKIERNFSLSTNTCHSDSTHKRSPLLMVCKDIVYISQANILHTVMIIVSKFSNCRVVRQQLLRITVTGTVSGATSLNTGALLSKIP